ncbi:MAG: TIGR02391 family protein [Candidatus Peribacteraceae bacterium]|nr:TIGR02391 family protein [Candidatus Peribacteraceae bacterium]
MSPKESSCPVCGFDQFQIHAGGSSREYTCECARCGRYYTTHEFLIFHHDRNYAGKWHLLSGLIREMNDNGKTPEIMYKELDKWLADPRIPKDDDADGKAQKMLSYLRQKSLHFGSDVSVHLQSDRSVAYARNDEEFDALIRLLRERGFLTGGFQRTRVDQGDFVDATGKVSLTHEGWQLAKKDNHEPSQEISDPAIQAPVSGSKGELFDSMCFHGDIAHVSRNLFASEHYAQAVFEAFKAVNNAVKVKSKIADDGQSLMGVVFKKDDPVLKINALRTQSDRDEQDGFKLLFMGAMTGIRNPKAHDNVVLEDPYRALHYLAFASLLRTRVDESTRPRSASACIPDRQSFFAALNQNAEQSAEKKMGKLFDFAEKNPLGTVAYGIKSFKFKLHTENGVSTVFVASTHGSLDMICRLWEQFPKLRERHADVLSKRFPFIQKSKLLRNKYYEVDLSKFSNEDIDDLLKIYSDIVRELSEESKGENQG